MRNSYPISRSACAAAALSAIMLLAGCAGTSAPPLTKDQVQPASTPVIEQPAKPARVRRPEELELTVTESIRIGSGVRTAYESALQQLQAGATRQGIATLEGVIAEAPQITAPHINLGMAYAQIEEFDKAETSLQHALVLTPQHPVALNELGIVYRRTGRFEQARASYEAALEVMESYHYAQRNLAVLCDLFMQDLQCALENYLAYQQAFPDDRQVAVWIADLQRRTSAPATPPPAGGSE